MQRHDAAGEALPADARKTGRSDHLGKQVRPRKLTDRFDEVLIGLGVAGHGAAERWNDFERKQIVNSIEPRHIDGGEFQAQESAAWLEHTERFAERKIDP